MSPDDSEELDMEELIADFSWRDKMYCARKALRAGQYRWALYYTWASIPTCPVWIIVYSGCYVTISLALNIWATTH